MFPAWIYGLSTVGDQCCWNRARSTGQSNATAPSCQKIAGIAKPTIVNVIAESNQREDIHLRKFGVTRDTAPAVKGTPHKHSKEGRE